MKTTTEQRPAAARTFTAALAGNPNSGKSSVFNALTGARQKVANYPGVTVERHEGLRRGPEGETRFLDLPGAYSLNPYSDDEAAARDSLLSGEADAVINVVDASNLERNLYLTLQMMELGLPLAMALNMSDLAERLGRPVDAAELEKALGLPVVRTVGKSGKGVEELPAAARRAAAGPRPVPPRYGPVLEDAIAAVSAALNGEVSGRRLKAIRLLEEEKDALAAASPAALAALHSASLAVEEGTGESPAAAIAAARYAAAAAICSRAVKGSVRADRLSEALDAVVLNRALGIPLFLGLMYLVFQFTFTLAEAPMGWIESGFAALGAAVSGLWPEGSQSALRSLLVDGVIGGVGGVLVFLPNILLLFLAIALLEDSGYMARAAFLMDGVMRRMGLHGKSFIPMLLGFGCSVPAIMAARTLENRRDRLVTILVAPLMSCGARLPIYALLIPAFFPQAWRGPVLWGIYITGLLLAVVSARLLRSTLLRGEGVPFVLEMPHYHVPAPRALVRHMLERAWLYVKKAGTIILPVSILLWFLTTYPQKEIMSDHHGALVAAAESLPEGVERDAALAAAAAAGASERLAHTYSGRVGRALEPVLRPLGFDWKIGTALVGAFAAKEVFVAQMGIVYSVDGEAEDGAALGARLRKEYTPLNALCIMLFCLISAPCMATIAVTRKETGSWGWAMLQLGGLTALAWAVTFGVYTAGRLAGFGG